MLLHELVATTDAVSSTSSRLAKIEALATLLGRLEADEIAPAIGFLIAKPRQGRIGVGWRGLAALAGTHAGEPTLTVLEVDAALERLAGGIRSGVGGHATRGTGRSRRRRDGGGVGLPDPRDPRRAAHRCSRGRAARRGGARVGPGRADRAPRRDAVGRSRRDGPDRPDRRGRRARRGRAAGRPAGAADAGLDGGVGRRCGRDRGGGGVGRIQARRRPHPGASERRERAGLHAQPRRHHPSGARDRRGGSRAAGRTTSSWTARRCRWTPTAGRGRSRTPWRASARRRSVRRRCDRGSSTCCTSTGET